MGHLLTLIRNDNSPFEVPGLRMWFDAKDKGSISLNGTTVSQWSDKSGRANHATQGTALNQPKYVANGINNHPALEGKHDGTNPSKLLITDHATLDYTDFEIFAVAMRVADTGSSESIGAKYTVTGNQREHLLQIDGGSDKVYISISSNGTAVTNLGAASAMPLATPFIVNARFTASDLQQSINNGTAVTNNAVASIFNGTSHYTLFSRPTISDAFAGRIGEYLFYNRVLSSSERRSIASYLSFRWSIAIS